MESIFFILLGATCSANILGLTPEQKDIIRVTWEPMRKDILKSGTRVFGLMFKTHPNWKKLFSKFQKDGVPLQENPEFLEHVQNNVMASLTWMVDHMEDEVTFKNKVYQVGKRHTKRKVGRTHFTGMIPIVKKVLRKFNGVRFDKKAEAAWDRFLKVSMDILSDGAEGNQIWRC